MNTTQKKALILDTETAAMDGNMIELAWLDHKTGECFEQRFNPGCPIEHGAMAVHHIIDSDVVDMPLHTTATLPDGVEYIIGHKVDYDMQVIKRSGIKIDGIKTICTLTLARKAWPELTSHTIGGLMYFLSASQDEARRNLKGAHTAFADVCMTEFILQCIIKKMGLGDNPLLLHIASEKARTPTKWPFKKHKDELIVDVVRDDPTYIQWALKEIDDLDPYLRKAILDAQIAN